VTGFVTQFGESFVGSGADAAHINTVLGAKGGPVETAWTTALATPRPGHAAFVTILRPGIPAKPMTLFVNKATVTDPGHSGLTWGPAQAGVASGVMWAVADGIVDPTLVDDLLLICAVWVSPEAGDEGSVYTNNRQATRQALESGQKRTPTLDQAMAVRDAPLNGYYLPPGTV
jgi:5,6,7,8-tetrahydromethanopterin hydro-lyase